MMKMGQEITLPVIREFRLYVPCNISWDGEAEMEGILKGFLGSWGVYISFGRN